MPYDSSVEQLESDVQSTLRIVSLSAFILSAGINFYLAAVSVMMGISTIDDPTVNAGLRQIVLGVLPILVLGVASFATRKHRNAPMLRLMLAVALVPIGLWMVLGELFFSAV